MNIHQTVQYIIQQNNTTTNSRNAFSVHNCIIHLFFGEQWGAHASFNEYSTFI